MCSVYHTTTITACSPLLSNLQAEDRRPSLASKILYFLLTIQLIKMFKIRFYLFVYLRNRSLFLESLRHLPTSLTFSGFKIEMFNNHILTLTYFFFQRPVSYPLNILNAWLFNFCCITLLI